MSKTNTDFDIPYYIFEAIINYVSFNTTKSERNSKLENIQLLLNLAVSNNKLSKEQAQYIKKTFCNI